MKEYTLEIYRADRRIKEDRRRGHRAGLRLVEVKDFDLSTQDYINSVAKGLRAQNFIVDVHETYVTRTNMMGGREYRERYDTPNYCSPSSESYWSM